MNALTNDISTYLKEHKILDLLNHLSEMVFFFKPENPVEFMAQIVLDMKKASEAGMPMPSLYNEDSFRGYFRLLDPAGVGMISWGQVKSALTVLGFKKVKVPALTEMPVFENTFIDFGMKCVKNRLRFHRYGGV